MHYSALQRIAAQMALSKAPLDVGSTGQACSELPPVRSALPVLQGNAVYAPEKEAMVWKIKNFPGGKEFLLRCKFGLPSVEAEEEQQGRMPPIRVSMELCYFTISGIQVGAATSALRSWGDCGADRAGSPPTQELGWREAAGQHPTHQRVPRSCAASQSTAPTWELVVVVMVQWLHCS